MYFNIKKLKLVSIPLPLIALLLIANLGLSACLSGMGNTATVGTGSIISTANTTAQSLTVGTAMTSFSPLTPSGGTSPYTYSVSSGTLPTGLSLNASTGAVTGTPTATYTKANVVFSVQDANNVVASTTSTVSFTVTFSATADTTAQSLTVGTAMTSFSPLTPSGGTSPYTYSVSSGTLPTGLSLNASTGAVTGTPTTVYATANVVFSVQDANGVVSNTTSTVSFTVGAASASITATATTTAQSLTVGTAMTSFSPLTPSGGTTPYTYSYTGTLPTGLSFSTSTGAVTGTPSATYSAANVVFSVQDANSVVASTTSTVSFTVAALPSGYVYEGGLTWMPISTTEYIYSGATTLCAGTINGTTDWRLPTEPELSALYTSGLITGQGWSLGYTWTSTLYSAGYHWYVYLPNGGAGAGNDPGAEYVTCVR